MAPTFSKVAQMEQAAPNKILILTARELTPENICAFAMASKAYFCCKEVADDNQVAKVVWGIQDPQIQNWYLGNQARIEPMDFDTFITELQRYGLPSDWEHTTCANVLGTHQGDRPLGERVMEMQSTNTLLYGTASYLSELSVRNQLEVNQNVDLMTLCQHDFIDNVPDYNLWLEAVQHLDKKRRREMAVQRQLVEDVFRDHARRRDPQNLNVGTTDRRPNNNNTGNTNTTSTST